MRLVPVDHDPFAAPVEGGAKLVPVDHDPFAGEAPRDLPAISAPGSGSAAVGRGIVNGVPVVGPYLLAGINRAAAGIRSLQNDTKFSDELRAVERFGEATEKEHPWASTAGEVGGGIVGTLPLVAAAPAAFGIGPGSLGVRSAAGLGSGAALGAADSAVRSGGDLQAAGTGAVVGGVLGGAGPGVGRLVGKGVAMIRGGDPGEPLLREAVSGLSEAELASAQFIRDQARALPGGGVALSVDEAVNAATGGKGARLSQLARVAAHSGGEGGRIAAETYAGRPAAVDNVARTAFEAIAPQNLAPSQIGADVQAAARAGLMQTPEGQALSRARVAAGPRVTPEQAGQAIQADLGGVRDLREAARSARANVDYRLAREAPERFGIERTVTVERPGEPLLQTLDTPPARGPEFRGPPDGPPTLDSLAPLRPEASAAGGRGVSIDRFMAENGGIGLERGDIKAAGLDRYRQPGVANLVREDGKSIDAFWRERLIEEGYLPPDRDGGMARNVHDEVLALLEEAAKGRKTYPYDYLGHDDRSGFGAMRDEFQAAAGTATADVRRALAEAGVDPKSVHRDFIDRAAAALVRGDERDPLQAFEAVVMASREPVPRPVAREVPTTVTEEVPDVRFGQVDPRAALAAVAEQGRTAKGDVRGALGSTGRDLREPGGDLDMSVAGLLKARERLDFRITQAQEIGDRTKVRDLQVVRSELDARLKQLPEVATADANFVRNSVPLEPFEGNAPLARIARRDDQTGRMVMPAEQVPGTLSGPTALREALANGTPATRQAYEGRLITELVDTATGADGNLSADALRRAMREHADVLDLLPQARDRLSNLVVAREGMARLDASPLGRIAQAPEVDAAIRTLFTHNPLPGSQNEVAAAMGALARNRPQAARDLARIYLESVFNEATQQAKGLPAQYGGAGFASAVRGNAQQRHNLEAAVRALPEGETLWTGLDRMLTTLEATGYRPQKGSDTAFNMAIRDRLKDGGTAVGQAVANTVSGAVAGAAVGSFPAAMAGVMLGARRSVGDAMVRARLLGNTDALARLMFDPRALPDLRALAKSPPGSRNADLFTHRLLVLLGATTSREVAEK